MKRFYEKAAARAMEDGTWAVELDGRPVRTPAGVTLCTPTRSLADAVCAEWNAQSEKVDTLVMPMTRMVNAAIDLVPAQRNNVIDEIVRFGETDLLCYRAPEPEALVKRQLATWQPVLDWLLLHYDAPLHVTDGIAHVAQPEQSLAIVRATLAEMSDFELAAMSNLAAVLGSIVLALAVRDGAISNEEAWAASILDEMFQAEQWGEDAEATERRAKRRADFDAATQMLNFSSSTDD